MYPSRIVSLVPSQTELLYDLGLDTAVAGITKFCIHPGDWFNTKPRIGGTKTINIDQVKKLQPDLIIANKEENVKEQVAALSTFCPVWTSDTSNLAQALEMIASIGTITGTAGKAAAIVNGIRDCFLSLPASTRMLRAAYLIWQDPYMTIGGDTFIHDMLTRSGFENVFKNQQRYPVISVDDIKESDCEVLLLSSEPYPFKQQHVEALQRQLPSTKVILADGEMFSWYGSRLLQAPAYFSALIKKI